MLRTHKFIKTYTGERYQIFGTVTVTIWRHKRQDVLTFNITDNDFASLLSLRSCTQLGIVTINDSDNLVNTVNNSPRVKPRAAPRTSLSTTTRTTEKQQLVTRTEDLLAEYHDVFQGFGNLPSEHHIVRYDSVKPVIQAPSRVPVPLRDKVKANLEEMVER